MAAVLVHGRAGGAPAPAKSPAKSRAATKVRTAASPARSHSRLRACSACKFLAGPCSLSQLTAHNFYSVSHCTLAMWLPSVGRYAEQWVGLLTMSGTEQITVQGQLGRAV